MEEEEWKNNTQKNTANLSEWEGKKKTSIERT